MKFKRPYLAIVFIILFQTAISWADGIQFSNNATSALASGITAIATSLTVTTGEGALFPSITPPDYFMVTLVDTSGNKEIVKVTARSTDTLTIVREQEGTTGRIFATGSVVSNRITAGTLDNFTTKDLLTEQGDLYYASAASTPAALAHAAAGALLKTGGDSANPSWSTTILTESANTFNITNGTAVFDVAAASTVNIDGSLTVESASLVNQDLTTDASPTFTTVNAALSGNATTASSAAILTTARTIGGVSFDGSANITVETATNGFTLTGNAIGKRLLVSNGASPDGDSGIRIYAPISTTHYNWLIAAQQNVNSSFEITPSTAVGGTTFNTPGFLLDNAGIVTLGAYGAGTATFSAAGVISSDTTPDLGTPSAVVLTNGTGLPISTGVSDLGANIATFLATPSSANLATAITNETGSSLLVFNTSPTLVTPVLGAATGTSLATTGDITTSAGAIGIGDAAPDRPLVIEDSGAIIRMTRETSDNAIFAPGILFERGRDAGADIVANDWLLKLTARGMVSGAYVNYSVLAVRATDTTNNAIWEFYDQDSVTLRASVDTNNGNIWAEGDVSALTFTDRTPFYEGNALSEIAKIKGKNGKIDHTTLPSFVHKVGKKIVYGLDGESKKMVAGEEDESRRDLGAMISMLTVAVQQLNDKIKILENKGN